MAARQLKAAALADDIQKVDKNSAISGKICETNLKVTCFKNSLSNKSVIPSPLHLWSLQGFVLYHMF